MEQLSQQVRKMSGVIFGQPSENEQLENGFWVFRAILRFAGSSACEAAVVCGGFKMPGTAGRMEFLVSNPKTPHHTRNGLTKNGLKIYVLVQSHRNFCVVWCRASIFERRGF